LVANVQELVRTRSVAPREAAPPPLLRRRRTGAAPHRSRARATATAVKSRRRQVCPRSLGPGSLNKLARARLPGASAFPRREVDSRLDKRPNAVHTCRLLRAVRQATFSSPFVRSHRYRRVRQWLKVQSSD
jgi:hypothetical protein